MQLRFLPGQVSYIVKYNSANDSFNYKFVCVKNISVLIVGASSAAGQAFRTPITARSVPCRRKTGMAVQRLSTSVRPRRISSMSGKNMVSKRGDIFSVGARNVNKVLAR